jgi:tetratricopeptide (TPR) repeat protein
MNQNKELDVEDFFCEGTDKSTVLEFLSSLPKEGSREWETSLTDLVKKEESVNIDSLKDILKDIIDDEADEYDDDNIKFAAFFAYCTRLRRNQDFLPLNQMMEDFEEYDDRIMYQHLKGMAEKGEGKRVNQIEKSLEYSRRAAEWMENKENLNNAGVYHSLASGLIKMMENSSEEITDENISEAEKYIELAIENSDYAKFYATKGRLETLKGRYDRADELFQKAINKEDSNQRRYAVRVGKYQMYSFKNDFQEKMSDLQVKADNLNDRANELDDRVGEAEEEMSKAVDNAVEDATDYAKQEVQKSRTSTLQVLGFFSAILAVVITTVQISTSFTPSNAAFLFLILTGGLTASFSVFSVLLSNEDVQLKRLGFSLLASLVLIVIGLIGILGF